ncbi:MAG TPA: GNAT family N-acetyltransferase [Gammaproteobacteria bacterium]|jgi:predicted GNAT family N-acyltransferase
MSHPALPRVTIRQASWQEDAPAISRLRRTVFIDEQCVPEELEWDGLDEEALHFLAEDENGHAIATARMLGDGHIGRVAVLRPWRGRGVGRALMAYVIEQARRKGYRHLALDAQVEAIDFYRRLGFVAEGERFMDAGIPHRHMHLALDGEHQSA